MSSESAEPLVRVTIHGSSTFEDEDEALEKIVQLKDLDFGGVFTNRSTSLSDEEGSGISIIHYHDESPNSLSLRTDDSGELSLRLSISEIDLDATTDILDVVLDTISTLSIDEILIQKDYRIVFGALGLPIEDGSPLTVTGVRFNYGEYDIILQEDDDMVHSTLIFDESESYSDEVPDNILFEKIGALDELIEEDLQ